MFWLQCQFTASSSAPIRPLTFVVQLLSRVWLCVTPMDCSTPGFILPHCFPEFAQIYVCWVMPSNCLTPCCPLSFSLPSFPASGSFPVSQLFASGGQSIGASALVSVLPMNIQGWFSLGLTGLIFLYFKRLWSFLSHHSLKTSILWPSALFLKIF